MMKRERGCRRAVLCAVLFLGLTFAGVTYAGWSHRLTVTGNAGTGILDVVYSGESACLVSVVDGEGEETREAEAGIAAVSDGGKNVEVTFPLPVAAMTLLEEPDRMIKLVCPVKVGEESTVNAVEQEAVDFTLEPAGEVSLEPVQIFLTSEDAEDAYEIPADEASGFDIPLKFDVFRGTEEQNGVFYGAIYLRLKDETRNRMGEMPEELFFEAEDVPEELLDALEELAGDESDGDGSYSLDLQITVAYRCTLPLYIGQGYDDSLSLNGE